MKKLIKLLALVLAAVMLLPTAALAAEDGGPKLVVNWLDWDEDGKCYVRDEVLSADDHGDDFLGYRPGRGDYLIFFVLDGDKKTPILPNAGGSGNITVTPVARTDPEAISSNAKESEYYVCVRMNEYKDGTITAEYNGETLNLPVTAALDEIGMYTKPEATPENMITDGLGYSPLLEESSCYLISTATDESNGRHLVDMALNEDCEDNAAFQLEKISDNVYKLTLTGSIERESYNPLVDITWQNVKFMGGNTYTEPYGLGVHQRASTLVTDINTMELDMSTPTLYQDVKDKYGNKLTMKAGESVTTYVAFTNFAGDPPSWAIRLYGAAACKASDSSLKLTVDEDNPLKLTVSCDVPGTYTFTMDASFWAVTAVARYHADGKPYTQAEFDKWDEVTPIFYEDGKLLVVTDLDNWTALPFEEAYPGETIEYYTWRERDVFVPVTVTVESAAPAFTDVKEGAWYESAVRFVSGKGYMNGSDGKFNPEGKITGAEFSQLLYNKAGKPAAADGASFQGVAGAWYEPAMLWAAGEGIITDTGDTAITPEDNLTRQQIALMLYNSLGKPEGTASLTAFSDADQISSWAEAAMEWAVSAKVFQGSDGKLAPTDTATRAEVAQLLLNYFGK